MSKYNYSNRCHKFSPVFLQPSVL